MEISELKNMSLPQLQECFASYLRSLPRQSPYSASTIATSKTIAFYLCRHGMSLSDFWKLIEDDFFENHARQQLAQAIEKSSDSDIVRGTNSCLYHLRQFRNFALSASADFTFSATPQATATHKPAKLRNTKSRQLPTPCATQVELYLAKWNTLESYSCQEQSLNCLFSQYAPTNTSLSDILLKVSVLNDFYSTNLFSTYPVAKHIFSLNIDRRLSDGDPTLVNDIKSVKIGNSIKHFYSFATKYCSHHNPLAFPIYDSYVHDVLVYFEKRDHFANFSGSDLKDYLTFKQTLLTFQTHYGLTEYSLKELDRYLWQLGKEYFPKHYKKKSS